MGYGFPLECANLVAYMTSHGTEAPRVARGTIENLLGSMVHGEEGRPVLFSRDSEWVKRLQTRAQVALQKLQVHYVDHMVEVAREEVAALLDPLKRELSSFSLYALVVDEHDNRQVSQTLDTAARFLAESERDVLVLLPSVYPAWTAQVLDPFPAFGTALDHAESWPGLLCWSPRGASAFVAAADVHDAAIEVVNILSHGGQIDAWLTNRQPCPSKRILHLSDLHFGSDHAATNLALLEAELFDVVKSVDRIVITGDLFDNPEQTSANSFRAFRNNIGRLAQQEPIVVPGNHDQRILGNVGQSFKQVANLNWRTHVVDDRLGVCFLCFNSAEAGSFARGRITDNQLSQVAGDWRNAIAMRPDLRGYLPIVLVHHHPFSFGKTKPRTWIQRALACVGMDEEQFLEMEDAQSFVDWCARWRASVILHGHKHQARFIDEDVSPQGSPSLRVSAIGCGSSLGAEGSALSYNIVHWDARRQRWAASFFESVNAGPFVQRAVMVDRCEPATA
jgi:Calcineurin-like phosphoesterase